MKGDVNHEEKTCGTADRGPAAELPERHGAGVGCG